MRLVDLYLFRGGTWWHRDTRSGGDPTEHVTVRYNRYSARRCHIYRDGTGTIRPPRSRANLASDEGLEGSDWSVEFSDREEDQENPEPVGNDEVRFPVSQAGYEDGI